MGSSKSDEIAAQSYFQGEIGLSTLVNKLGITDQKKLTSIESQFVEHALFNLSVEDIEFSTKGLKKLHKEMFGEVYEWAGEFRTYTTARSYPFCRPEYIEHELDKLYRKTQKNIFKDMNQQEFVKQTAKFIGDLNAIHPFLDGNGRTQRFSLIQLAERAKIPIHIENNLSKTLWYAAAEESHIYGKYNKFEQIISSVILNEHQKVALDSVRKVLNLNFKETPELLAKKHEELNSAIPDFIAGNIELPVLTKTVQPDVEVRNQVQEDKGLDR